MAVDAQFKNSTRMEFNRMRSSCGSVGRTATVLVHSTVLDVRSDVVCHFSNLVSSTRVRGDLVFNFHKLATKRAYNGPKEHCT